MNTPYTFSLHPWLRYWTLALDCVTGLVLTCEAIIKILAKGFVHSKQAYLRSPGRIFEFIMVICIVVSIILQVLEITISIDSKVSQYLIISFIRAPRPLLLLRVMKSILNLSLPKTVSYRSMKQIWGVLLFTAYFMSLAAVIGVQMFGLMKFYCVENGSSVNETTFSNFLIPVTRCTPKKINQVSFQCPSGFQCKELTFQKFRQERLYFDQILTGLLTVYEAASMEGWSLVMYDAMDTRYFLFAVLYFVCLIFFIAWMVRNVFIAIITEAFADLRVQVSKLSQPSPTNETEEHKVLRKFENSEIYLEKEEETFRKRKFTPTIFKLVDHKLFKYFIHLCVLADAVIQGFFHGSKYENHLQITFTALFNVEAILKIIGMGFYGYINSVSCQLEAILCVGSTAFLAPVLQYKGGFSIFQVLRTFRLVLLSSSLTSFLKRILGSGKKITNLVVFTLSALIIASGITLQLFSGIGQNEEAFRFRNFSHSNVCNVSSVYV